MKHILRKATAFAALLVLLVMAMSQSYAQTAPATNGLRRIPKLDVFPFLIVLIEILGLEHDGPPGLPDARFRKDRFS